MKFCFVCGKKTDEMIEGQCHDCYSGKYNIIEVPKEMEIKMCGRCMRKFDRNKWREIDLKDIILEKVKILGESVNIKTVSEEDGKGRIIATGFLKGMNKPKEEIHDLKMRLNKVTCPTCAKEAGLYYESTLQIRGKMLTHEDFDAMDDITRNREGFYRLLRVAGGCDFKVSSKSLAKKLAEYVVKKYKIDKKLSFHLVTKREGRDLYRDTILLRID